MTIEFDTKVRNVVVARFMGRDGSLGYRHGKRYLLEVSPWGPSGVVINTRSRKDSRRCPYSSVQAFHDNWDVEKVQE